ncbi:MAG: T9SS type A sorting domain-containing protein [Ignavibacteria bacterium]
MFVGTYGAGLYLSTNNGTNWTALTNGLPYNAYINAILINGNSIFAGTWGTGIYLSTNNGASWSSISNGLPGVSSVESLADNTTNIFAGIYQHGIYTSTNNGVQWFPVNNGIPANAVIWSLAASETNVFAGSYTDGVYASSDNGANWVQANEGLNNLYITNLAVNNDYVFAGLNGEAVWRRPLSELIGVKKISESVPQSYALYQNYPNPFNPATKIKFQIPLSPLYERGVGGFVTLKIYDLLGRKIATLVNEQLKPGTYEVEWDASIYSSGVYFYKIKTESFNQTQRMVLLK